MPLEEYIVIMMLLMSALTTLSVSAAYYPPRHCAECEEEVWEEVPCNRVPTSTTQRPATSTTIRPTTTTTRPTTTTYAPPTVRPPTLPPYTPAYTPPPPPPTTTSTTPYTTPVRPAYPLPTIPPLPYGSRSTVYGAPAPPPTGSPSYDPPSADGSLYKQCYCDCKVGCKEFCRKLNQQPNEVNPPMQITQITKTVQKLPGGRRVETKHEHRYLAPPTAATAGNGDGSGGIGTSSLDLYHQQPPVSYTSNKYNEISKTCTGDALSTSASASTSPSPSSSSSYDIANVLPYSNNKPPTGYPNALVDASTYTLEELARLLQLDALDKTRYIANAYETPTPPSPQPPSLPSLPPQRYAPVYSNVLTDDDDHHPHGGSGGGDKSVSASAHSRSKGTVKNTGAYTTNYLIKDAGQYAELNGGGYPSYEFAMDNYFKHAYVYPTPTVQPASTSASASSSSSALPAPSKIRPQSPPATSLEDEDDNNANTLKQYRRRSTYKTRPIK